MLFAILAALAVAAPPNVPLPPPPPGARASGTLVVAVPAAKIVGDVPLRTQAAFELSLVAELRKLDGIAAMGAGDIGDALSAEAEGRMRGCTQDDACLLEVAGALGLSELLSSEIVLEGGTYVMTFRRLSVRTGKPVATDVRRAKKGNGEELLSAVGPLVQVLYPDRALRANAVRGVDPEVEKRLNPPPLPRWVFAATATAAVTSLVAGATFGVMANNAKSDLQALADQSQSSVVSGAEWKSLQDQLDANAKMANIFLAVGAGLAVVSIGEAFFTDWHDYGSQLMVVPAPGGAMVTATGKF
jgi:hypothetical protein